MGVWVGVAVGGCSGVKVCDGKGRSVPVNCGRGVDVVGKLVVQPARIPARSNKSVNFTFGMLPIIPSREAQLFLLILVMNEMPKITFLHGTLREGYATQETGENKIWFFRGLLTMKGI